MAYSTIQRARAQMMLEMPFFATLLMQTDMRPAPPDVALACTDGKKIYVNEAALNARPVAQVKTVLVHELLHIIYLHFRRWGTRNAAKWQEATDHAINLTLKACKFESFGWAYCDEQYRGLHAEAIYELLPDPPQNGGGQGDELSDDMRPDLGGGPSSAEEEAVHTQRMRHQVAGAAMLARMQGKMPEELERMISGLLDPKVPWFAVLRDYLQRTAQDDEAWSRRNRRIRTSYLPTRHSEKMGEITIIVDTSGSIREEELTQAMSEVSAIATQLSPERIRIVWADAKVAGEQVFEEGDALTPEPAGGGGTDMRVPLKHIEQYDPHVAILITDGYTPWPTTETPYPLIVCCTTDETVPIGSVIRMR